MSYNVRYTDPTKGSIVVEDPTINRETDLAIPGRFSTAYGQSVAENMVHLLENFASPEEPQRAVEGQLWYDSSTDANQLKVFDGTTWKAAGGVKRGASQPSVENSITGDLWVNTNTQQLFMFSGVSWVLVGPQASFGGQTSAESSQIRGIDDVEHQVLRLRVENNDIAIISSDEFIPSRTISGFPVIKKGINLNSGSFGGDVLKYRGRSESADALVVGNENVSSSNFLRSDAVSTSNHKIRVLSDDGIDIGLNGQIEMGVSNNVGIIRHKKSNSSFEFRFNNEQGNPETSLVIESNGRLTISGDCRTRGNSEVNGKITAAALDTNGQISAGRLVVNGPTQFSGDSNISGTLSTSNILPSGNNSIGTVTNKYNRVYAKNIFADEFIGELSGGATTASRLTAPREFKISGAIRTTESVFFDGTSPVDLNVEFSVGIFDGVDGTTSANDTDRVLINTGSDIKTVAIGDIKKTIPSMHPGMIMPFASSTAPAGWLICEGQELDIEQYQELYNVIGDVFGEAPEGKFKIPDFRGRFPIGSNPERELGSNGGSPSAALTKENLPEHEHTFMGDAGNQYYAVRPSTGLPLDSNSTVVSIQGSGSGTHGLTTTGGINEFSSVAPFSTLNPYVAVNYIIFSGVIQ